MKGPASPRTTLEGHNSRDPGPRASTDFEFHPWKFDFKPSCSLTIWHQSPLAIHSRYQLQSTLDIGQYIGHIFTRAPAFQARLRPQTWRWSKTGIQIVEVLGPLFGPFLGPNFSDSERVKGTCKWTSPAATARLCRYLTYVLYQINLNPRFTSFWASL